MGKVLSVSRKDRELTRVSLTKQSLTVGRSPLCDVTLRIPGMNSVHYLLDWANEGEFNSNRSQQEWSLIDISQEKVDERSAKSQIVGLGQIISEKPVKVGDLTFRIVEDKLHETILEGGSLHNSLLKEKRGASQQPMAGTDGLVLEVIRITADSGTVTEVAHLSPRDPKKILRPIKVLPGLTCSWLTEDTVGFRMETDNPEVEISQWRVQRIQPIINKKDFKLEQGSFIQVDYKTNEYYFRIVPRVAAPAIPMAWSRDGFLWAFLFTMLLSFGLLNYIKSLPRSLEEKPVEPLRIAKVEVESTEKKAEPPPPPPPPPPKVETKPPPPPPPEPPKPAPVPKEKPKEMPKTNSKSSVAPSKALPNKNSSSNAAGKPAENKKLPPKNNLNNSDRKAEVPDSSLNSPAPEKPVGAVGLLGALKSQKGRPSEIRADQVINDGVVSKTLSADDGSAVVVKRNPPGIISNRNFKGSGQGGSGSSGLMAAAGKVGGGDTIKADAIGGISGSGRNSLESSMGMAGAGSGSGISALRGENSDSDLEVAGGLDKESIRRTLRQYRQQIRTCYERALSVQKNVKGRILFKWLISSSGPTVWVNLVNSEVGSSKLDTCVKDLLQSINWPKAPNKQETMVNYRFQFQSKN